jgi:hypothetical protein
VSVTLAAPAEVVEAAVAVKEAEEDASPPTYTDADYYF